MRKYHLVVFIFFLFVNNAYASSNLTINVASGYTFPTSVSEGTEVSAYYNVTNQTSTTRTGYLLKGQPSTVSQGLSALYCSNPISLTSHASCILKLNITGEAKTGFALCNGSSCASSATPLNVSVTSTLPPVIAAGRYNNGLTNYPLLASSSTGGTTWSYTIDSATPTLPADFANSGTFTSASCNGQICIAGGQYNNGTISAPLLATSTNGGSTWIYTIDSSNLPSDFVSDAFFSSVSCSEQTCVAVGQYYNGASLPMLATSLDGGITWTYTIDGTTHPSTPSDFNADGYFASASCSGSDCITGGYYFNGSQYYPMLATSLNKGVTWAYTINSSTPSLPNDFVSDGYINSVSCDGGNCVAGGQYANSTQQYPLLASSLDGGISWTYTISSTTPTLPLDYVGDGVFRSVSCRGQNCIAAGQYRNSTGYFPLLATSLDGGISWSYTIQSTMPQLPSDYVSGGVFFSTSCSSQSCIAAGQYSNGIRFYPLLATSLDNGMHWTYTIDSSTPTLPLNYESSGNFNGVSCNGKYCVAAGLYYSGSSNFPLLASSVNGGINWSYTITNSTPTLPSNYVGGGILNGTSISH